MNCESLLAHFAQIQIAIKTYEPAIMMLSETCVTSEIYQSEIIINGYNVVRCNSHSRHTGGVIIYIRKGVKYTETTNLVFDNNVWLLGITITAGFDRGFYGVLYHSPNKSDADFLTYFESWCDDNIESNKVCIYDSE